jgi:flagellin-like protein
MDSQKDRAISPVIGTIIALTITVILAALIAALIFTSGNSETGPTPITVIDKCTGIDGLYRLVYDDNKTAVVDAPEWNKAVIGEKYYADIGYGYSNLANKEVIAIFDLLTEEEYKSTCEGKGYKC